MKCPHIVKTEIEKRAKKAKSFDGIPVNGMRFHHSEGTIIKKKKKMN
jgi:hypothetical protein